MTAAVPGLLWVLGGEEGRCHPCLHGVDGSGPTLDDSVPRGCLAMSGVTFGCRNWARGRAVLAEWGPGVLLSSLSFSGHPPKTEADPAPNVDRAAGRKNGFPAVPVEVFKTVLMSE